MVELAGHAGPHLCVCVRKVRVSAPNSHLGLQLGLSPVPKTCLSLLDPNPWLFCEELGGMVQFLCSPTPKRT